MVTRRFVLASLFGTLAIKATSQTPKNPTKWYITGGRRATQRDCDVEPIETYGRTILEAIENSGMTIWSEEKYAEFKKIEPAFKAACKLSTDRIETPTN